MKRTMRSHVAPRTRVKDVKKIVLAYSGGLDTSVILRWLIETYRAEVVVFCADLGQGEELDPVRDKALKTGASRVYIKDLKEEFVRDLAGGLYRVGSPLSSFPIPE